MEINDTKTLKLCYVSIVIVHTDVGRLFGVPKNEAPHDILEPDSAMMNAAKLKASASISASYCSLSTSHN